MTEEQIKQRAEDFIDRINRESGGHWNEEYYLSDLLVMFATEATKELEKKNVELETDYEVLSCSVGDFGELQDKLEEEQRKNNGLSDNLTKAKELLKRCYENYIYLEPLRSEIEQFLKEE